MLYMERGIKDVLGSGQQGEGTTMRYRPYRLNMECTLRELRKRKLIKLPKAKSTNALQAAMKWYYNQNTIKPTIQDAIIHTEEYNWLTSGKVVYFPEDAEMAENIMRGSYNIKSVAALYDGPESFIINLPDGLEFEGNDKGSGLLVTIVPHNQDALELNDRFSKWAETDYINVEFNNSQGSYSICVSYQDEFNSDEYMNLVIPSRGALNFLHIDSLDEYIERMEYDPTVDIARTIKLNRDEYAYQFEMMRFVCGFLVYKKALPERIKKGLPGIHHKEVETPITKDQSHYTVKSPKRSREVTGHYRSWHFRQLVADRYYQGIHAQKPKGSRVVFVSDSYVVQDVEALTVEAS